MAERTIWVVEDDDQNFELVEFLLEEAGYHLERATNAQEFAGLLTLPPPCLVLMDMNLAGTSGEILVAQLRGCPGMEQLPIVAITAHAMRGDKERFIRSGCTGYIAKPIDTGSFAGMVEAFFAQAEG